MVNRARTPPTDGMPRRACGKLLFTSKAVTEIFQTYAGEFHIRRFPQPLREGQAVVRALHSLSALAGERARVRCRSLSLAERLRAKFSQLSTFNS